MTKCGFIALDKRDKPPKTKSGRRFHVAAGMARYRRFSAAEHMNGTPPDVRRNDGRGPKKNSASPVTT